MTKKYYPDTNALVAEPRNKGKGSSIEGDPCSAFESYMATIRFAIRSSRYHNNTISHSSGEDEELSACFTTSSLTMTGPPTGL